MCLVVRFIWMAVDEEGRRREVWNGAQLVVSQTSSL